MINLIITLSICSILGTVLYVSSSSIQNQSTIAGTILLMHKLKSINSISYESIVIESGIYNNDITLDVENCELVFHPNGTAAKSGTCEGDTLRFTLRPGEGGIGYPW